MRHLPRNAPVNGCLCKICLSRIRHIIREAHENMGGEKRGERREENTAIGEGKEVGLCRCELYAMMRMGCKCGGK